MNEKRAVTASPSKDEILEELKKQGVTNLDDLVKGSLGAKPAWSFWTAKYVYAGPDDPKPIVISKGW